jgi:hypothetical protein
MPLHFRLRAAAKAPEKDGVNRLFPAPLLFAFFSFLLMFLSGGFGAEGRGQTLKIPDSDGLCFIFCEISLKNAEVFRIPGGVMVVENRFPRVLHRTSLGNPLREAVFKVGKFT